MKLPFFTNCRHESDLIRSHIRSVSVEGRPTEILEAGCGQVWVVDLGDLNYRLTGLDADADALTLRLNKTRDLHKGIEGDLTKIDLPPEQYDIIYNSYVLEHIKEADVVMQKFTKWLRPGGKLILRFPDRDSSYGFITRLTPFFIHVWYKRYVQGCKDAGKPGHDPYPTFYHPIVSRRGISEFCEKNGLQILEEWAQRFPQPWDKWPWLQKMITRTVWLLSFGKFAHAHNNLTYFISKPKIAGNKESS